MTQIEYNVRDLESRLWNEIVASDDNGNTVVYVGRVRRLTQEKHKKGPIQGEVSLTRYHYEERPSLVKRLRAKWGINKPQTNIDGYVPVKDWTISSGDSIFVSIQGETCHWYRGNLQKQALKKGKVTFTSKLLEAVFDPIDKAIQNIYHNEIKI